MEESIKALQEAFGLLDKIKQERYKQIDGVPRCALAARHLMTRKVFTISTEATIQEASQRMNEKQVSALVAMSSDGVAQGVLSQTDVAECFRVTHTDGMVNERGDQVVGWMSPHVIVATVDDTVEDICRMMSEHNVHRIFIKEEGTLVGVISTFDIIRVYSSQESADKGDNSDASFYPYRSEELTVQSDSDDT